LENAKKDEYYAIITNNLGVLYFNLGVYDRAEEFYKEALDVYKQSGSTDVIIINIHNNLGNLYSYTSQPQLTEQHFKKAIEICEKNNYTQNTEYMSTVFNLGYLYWQNGDDEKAFAHYEKSLQLSNKIYGETNLYSAYIFNALGGFYRKKNDLRRAKKYYKQSLEVFEKVLGNKHILYNRGLQNITDISYVKGDIDKTIKQSLKCNQNYINYINQNFLILSEKEKAQLISTLENSFEVYQNIAFDFNKKRPDYIATIYNNCLFHKSLIMRTNTAINKVISETSDDVLKKLYNDLISTKQERYNCYLKPAQYTPKYTDSIEKRTNELERQVIKIASIQNITDIDAISGKISVSYTDVKTALKDNEAAIEFIRFERYKTYFRDTVYYCALVLRHDYKYPKLVYLCTETELQQVTSRPQTLQKDLFYVNKLYGISKGKTTASDSLYQLVWQPLETSLKGIGNVYISPTGLLHNISFAAIASSDSSLLNDKYQINYVTSTKEIVNQAPVYFSEQNKVLLIGGIKYDVDSATMLKNIKQNSIN